MLCGSINRAADYLCVSQPVVSKTISQLEKTIDLQLFERKNSGLIPTKNAYVLNRYCEGIFEKTNKLSSILKQLKFESVDVLRLCASPALCNFLVPKIISEFKDEVNIKFESSMLSEIANLIEGGFFDVALSIWPVHSEKINCHAIGSSDFVFVCHKLNPLSMLENINFMQMAKQEFIFTNRGMPIGAYIDKQLSEAGLSFNRFMEVDRSDIVCTLINFGRGVSILNRHAVDPSIWTELAIIDLATPIPSSIYLITPKYVELSKSAESFINFITNGMGSNILAAQ